MAGALARELVLRKEEARGEVIRTIYFGGGTPSLLRAEELSLLLETIEANYAMDSNPEITLEANPDDLTESLLETLAAIGVNRLSIGIQSFHDRDLKLMNRAHNAEEAEAALEIAMRYFDNVSIDLIYGIPQLTQEGWKENLRKALSFKVPHISSYALTIEPGTALNRFIEKGLVPPPGEAAAEAHFYYMMALLEEEGFVQYELSNFGKPGYFSENNSAYWQGRNYLGIGPSAHSYDGLQRSWNVGNNPKYLRALNQDRLPATREVLSESDRYNEYIMTGLRTIWGVSTERVRTDFGIRYYDYLLKQAGRHLEQGLLELKEATMRVSHRGKFLTDGIASDLFMVSLKESKSI